MEIRFRHLGTCVKPIVGIALLVILFSSPLFPALGNQTEYGFVTTAYASTTTPNCRFGITVPLGISGYPVSSLGVESYLDWELRSNPVVFPGMEYIQVVRLRDDAHNYVFDPAYPELEANLRAKILAVATAQPGAAWLVGNEPDTTYENQDSLTPDQYAEAYHEVYYAIKAADPTALIGIGTIVQPTPLRMKYLDLFWAAYLLRYVENPPSDFWSIHSFILPETIGSWGTGIPPGMSAYNYLGMDYSIEDTDSIAIFKQRLVDFRTWMAGKGERNKPLWITEYGSLMPHDDSHGLVTFPITRTRDFMLATFDYLLTAQDPVTGYPLDGNHLVQQWYWYSLNDYQWKMGGGLFDPEKEKTITLLGQEFIAYVDALTPSLDLGLSGITLNPRFPATSSGETYTLAGVLTNSGNSSVPAGTQIIISEAGSDEIYHPVASISYAQALRGCGESHKFSVSWTESEIASAIRISVELPAGSVDIDLGNNVQILYANPFGDVPYDYWAYRYIETLYRNGFTAGCQKVGDPLSYCPEQTMTRAESAVFMLRGNFGSTYLPPAAPWDTFADSWVPGPWAEKWAEGMWKEKLTAGCQNPPSNPVKLFCPWEQFPRVQAAVFGLRMKYGVDYGTSSWPGTPPPASGTMFADLTDTSFWGTKWAEQAYLDKLLLDCGFQDGKPLFCPTELVNRAWGAYLIVNAKGLDLDPFPAP